MYYDRTQSQADEMSCYR